MYLQDGCTPLYVASAKGFNDVVESLIAANANVNCICKVSYCVAWLHILHIARAKAMYREYSLACTSPLY